MTIEVLLDCSVEQLEAMTDDELSTHFAPYLVVCAAPPKEADVVTIQKPKRKKRKTKNQSLTEQMQELANLHDVDLNNAKKLPKNLQ